jgi:pimeloyl-ACP methyl ester carboxylesterase
MCIVIHMNDELRDRLRRTRRVTTPWSGDDTRGISGTHLDGLHERRISALPWETVRAGETDLRVIHQRSADPGAPVVVLLHGWPDSVLRFERVLPLLADMHVVVPALPGFPFAAPLAAGGMSVNRIAGIVADVLEELGYSRYTVSGGDVGGTVAGILAAEHPDRVAALHLTNVAPLHALTADRATLAPGAVAYLDRSAQWFRTEGGYIAEQSTRPNTLAVAPGDSPAGLAAWIDTPTVLSVFPRDIKPEPRSYAEVFLNVHDYAEHRAGGHFAAWEQPESYVGDVHRAVELVG